MNIEINELRVSKDGEEIGMILGEICYLETKVGPTVKGAIKKEAGKELSFVVGNAPDEEDQPRTATEVMQGYKDKGMPTPTPVPVTSQAFQSIKELGDDELAAEMKRRGLIQENEYGMDDLTISTVVQPPVIERDLSAVERLHKLAGEGRIPRPPEKHPAMGDKDPAYVAWFKQHATPAEIATRYPDNRRIPASTEEFRRAQEKLKGKLPGEKKDTNKENDFTDKEDA
jgi:hypothetical protein